MLKTCKSRLTEEKRATHALNQSLITHTHLVLPRQACNVRSCQGFQSTPQQLEYVQSEEHGALGLCGRLTVR